MFGLIYLMLAVYSVAGFSETPLAVSGGNASCISTAPSPDEISKARKPELVGKIAKIEKSSIFVNNVEIVLPSQVNLFSEYGGVISLSELKIGDRVRVWNKDCNASKGIKKMQSQVVIIEK